MHVYIMPFCMLIIRLFDSQAEGTFKYPDLFATSKPKLEEKSVEARDTEENIKKISDSETKKPATTELGQPFQWFDKL